MKFQWSWVLGLLFAIIIAVFSVMNVDKVPVNYGFGVSEWPMVLIILASALLGAAISGFIALFRSVVTSRRIKELMKEVNEKEILIAAQQNELALLQKYAPSVVEEERTTDLLN